MSVKQRQNKEVHVLTILGKKNNGKEKELDFACMLFAQWHNYWSKSTQV